MKKMNQVALAVISALLIGASVGCDSNQEKIDTVDLLKEQRKNVPPGLEKVPPEKAQEGLMNMKGPQGGAGK